jgi:rubrerythrin
MEVLDYAIQMEKDGEDYYRGLAEKCSETGLVNILTRLADAEVKHREILGQIKDSRAAKLAKTPLRQDARNIFRRMIDEGVTLDAGAGEVGLYRKAQELEKKSRDFYLDKAADVGTPEAREIFFKIADEEKLHYDLLESIVEFVSRPVPGNWLENAEWYHQEEY